MTYNDVEHLEPYGGGWHLLTKKGGRWIATVPDTCGAILEWVRPCKVENPLTDVTGESALKYVLGNAEELAKLSSGGYLLAKLKKKLEGFSTRYRRFK